MRRLVALALCGLTATATAEPLTGKVLDRKSGTPIEGAVVHLQAPDGAALTTSTTADGSYGFDVVPGRYQITFLRGTAQQSATVVISADTPASLNGRLDDVVDEVIVIDDSKAPAVLPVPIRKAVRLATPPYSERAILEDAWTRAWLLLEVDARGTVTRLKLLKRPGYDLEPLAIAERRPTRCRPSSSWRAAPAPAASARWPTGCSAISPGRAFGAPWDVAERAAFALLELARVVDAGDERRALLVAMGRGFRNIWLLPYVHRRLSDPDPRRRRRGQRRRVAWASPRSRKRSPSFTAIVPAPLRLAAIAALGRMGSTGAIDRLVPLVHGDPTTRPPRR
jgi:hypothetical protein